MTTGFRGCDTPRFLGDSALRPNPGRYCLAASLLALTIGAGLADGSGAGDRTVAVAAASDLEPVLEALRPTLRQRHPDLDLRVTYGSSGAFFAQLQSGAPFDVFLSADVIYPAKLAEAGLAAPLDLFVYARGRLVVWALSSSPIDVAALGLQSTLHPAAQRIAIANPRHAPYGRAAEAALRSAGLLERVRPRLVFAENAAQAAQFVHTGAANLGFIPLSLALSPALRDQGRVYEIALDAYPALEQAGLVLGSSRQPEAARAFRAFLLSAPATAALRGFGFLVEGR